MPNKLPKIKATISQILKDLGLRSLLEESEEDFFESKLSQHLDSMNTMSLLLAIEKEFEFELDLETFDAEVTLKTAGSLAGFICDKLSV